MSTPRPTTAAGQRPAGPPGRPHGPAVGVPVAKPADLRGALRRLLTELRPERRRMLAVVVLTAGSVAGVVAGPKVLGAATDIIFRGFVARSLPVGASQAEVVTDLRARGEDELAAVVEAMRGLVPGAGIDLDALARVLGLAVAVYLVAWLLGYVQGLITTGVVQRTAYRLRERAEAKIGRLPLSYVDRQQRGELLSRVTNDVDNVAQTLQQTLSQVVNALLMVVGVLTMMLWISPLLALVALVTVPLAAVVTGLVAKRAQPQFVAQWARTGTVSAHVEEMFTGHELVKVYGRQAQASARFHEENEALFEASFRANAISGLIHPAMMFIGNLGYVLVAVVGGLRVASGAMSLGDVQAFIQYSRQFTQPLTQLASMANLVQSGAASAERVFELLDAPEQEPDPVDGPSLPPTRGHVVLDGVSFRYAPDTPLIEDLSLVVEPGRTVAIVGPTGAGKTTLVNLLMRFYELDGGRILLDGVDVATVDREDLRRRIGMVLQDTWLFRGTIAENIAYGRPGASREDVVAAARAAHVDHFVRVLPDGYETVVDEEASNLSAGEKQLLTIARAFLADPSILVLDEATSSVDTRTEVLVQRAMARLRADRTSFVIAHRLSTIRDADVILVMERGRIVEQGTHDELLAAGGAYAALHAGRSADAVPPTS